MENQNKSRVTRGGLTLRGPGREGRDPPGGHKYPRRWEIVWAAPASLTSGDAAERVRGLGHNDSAAATAVTAKRLTTHVAERAWGRACSSDDGRVPATTGVFQRRRALRVGPRFPGTSPSCEVCHVERRVTFPGRIE